MRMLYFVYSASTILIFFQNEYLTFRQGFWQKDLPLEDSFDLLYHWDRGWAYYDFIVLLV
jgi:hypothetical protein